MAEQQEKYIITVENEQAKRGLNELGDKFDQLGADAVKTGSEIDAVMSKIEKKVAGAFTAAAAIEFGKSIVDVRGDIESLEISFTTLLGSKQKAAQLFGEIREFATSTPMQLKDLASGAQTLLSFNYEADKVMTTLKALGDISMGDSQKFNSLTLAFAQMSATGKLMGQDFLQMVNAGFNPLQVMAEKTGKSIEELKDDMSKGAISAQMVEDAFLAAASSGGKFYGMLDAQSKSIKGALSNLRGAVDDMFNEIGEKSQGVFTDSVLTLTDMAKHYKEIGEAIAVLVGIYGTYKAAVAATTVIEKSAMAIKHTEEAAALEALLTVEQKEQVSKLNLSKNSAEYAAVVKKEAVANVEAAKAAAAKAQANTQASLITAKQAKEEYLYAVKVEKQALAGVAAAEASGDAKAIEAAKREAATAAILREEAATKSLAAQKAVETARTTQAAAIDAASTAAKTAETAATGADATAHGILTMAKNAATAAAAKLNAVIMANPYALAAAAVAALAYGIYKLATYENDAQRATRELKEATKECSAEIASEQAKVDILFGTLQGAKKGTQEYKEAKDAIISQYGDYLKGLSKEIAELDNVKAAYDAVTEAVQRAAKARAMDAYTKKATETYGTKYGEEASEIRNALLKKYGNKKGQEYYIKLKPVIEGQKQMTDMSKDLQDVVKGFNQLHVVAMGMGPAYTYTTNEITDGINNITRARKVMNDTVKEAQDIFGNSGLEETKKKEEPKPVVKNKKYWEQQVKDLQAELDLMTDAQVKSAEGQKKLAEIQAAQEKVNSYSASRTTAAGNKAETERQRREREALKKANEQTRRDNERAKQEREQKRQERQFGLEMEQARIDGMGEGYEKIIAQNNLNWEKLKEANLRRKEEYVEQLRDIAEVDWKNKNPDVEFKRSTISDDVLEDSFDTSGFSEEMQNIIATLRNQIGEYERVAAESHKRANDEAIAQEKQSINEYLAQYGDYLQKREAIKEQYDQKISKAKGIGERLSLEAERDKTIEALDMSELQHNWKGVFDGLDNMSLEALQKVKQRLEDALNGKDITPEAAAKFGEQLDKVSGLITQKRTEWTNLVGGAIGSVAKRMADIKQAEEDNDRAQEALVAATKDEAEAKARVLEIQKQITALAKDSGIELEAENVSTNNAADIMNQVANKGGDTNQLGGLFSLLGKSEREAAQSLEALSTATQNASQAMGAMKNAGGGAAGTISMIDTIIHGVNDNIQSSLDLLKELGLEESDFGRGMSKFAESSQYARQALDSLKSGNVMGVAAGVLGSLRTLGEALGEWGIAGFGSSDSTLHKDIERLTERNEILASTMERLKNSIDKASFGEINKKFELQKQNLQEAERNTREMMARSAAAYSNGFLGIGGKHSSNKNINDAMTAADWRKVSEAAGVSVNGASDFFMLTAEQMYKVANDASAQYDKIKQYANDGYEDAAQYMDKYIEYWEQMEEIQKQFNEKWTGVSYDSMKDAFVSDLIDMDKKASDFSKNFTKYMMQAMLNSKVSEVLEKDLDKFYKDWAAAASSGNKITESEQAMLARQWDEMVQKGLKIRDELASITGYDQTSTESSTSSKGVSGMTHDQADEVNGRFTAMQLVMEGMSQQVMNAVRELANVSTLITTNGSILTSINMNIASGNAYLADIYDVIVATKKSINSDLMEVRNAITRL